MRMGGGYFFACGPGVNALSTFSPPSYFPFAAPTPAEYQWCTRLGRQRPVGHRVEEPGLAAGADASHRIGPAASQVDPLATAARHSAITFGRDDPPGSPRRPTYRAWSTAPHVSPSVLVIGPPRRFGHSPVCRW